MVPDRNYIDIISKLTNKNEKRNQKNFQDRANIENSCDGKVEK